ncbi:MAG: phosphotransferase family protein [Chloroflexi bacterium]|nr:phosphotransferase family protein [Chloroflexota bacterium]
MTEPTLEHLIDLPALERFINDHVPGTPGPIQVEKHVAGFSNETFYVSRGGDRWVMRRPPAGPLLPTAHDVLREYRFLAGLHGRARVPRPVVACEDVSLIGAPFYLMERAEGVVIRTEIPAAYDTPEGRRRIGEEMVDALVELHAADWRAAGISGRDSGYVPRQVERWSKQWELTRPRTRELPGLDAITAWLKERIPAEVPHTVVHGDYKLDNVMFARDEPRLIAIFDWEMATIGDPLADLSYLLHSWAPAPIPAGYEARVATIAGLSRQPGFLSPGEMAARYERLIGRSLRDFLFYRVLAAYKLIVILEGLYMHYIEGAASNPASADFEWRVPMMVLQAEQMIATGGNDV